MLNGEAGIREVKGATTDFTNIPQTGPRNNFRFPPCIIVISHFY